jgi:hypothetical protein
LLSEPALYHIGLRGLPRAAVGPAPDKALAKAGFLQENTVIIFLIGLTAVGKTEYDFFRKRI